ncbi:MAG: molecular chaperone DnaJ [Peptoniphilaceae bacterium]|nr:molecular chaperone DnaJ [Peptoniphilaceae bacterium]MDD7383502.1 molecular chaperone DnaJ [Peptoniphilaceae bacterium]MDY3738675.1 molecular chaperone DnaJ [Peptoniphilaceae bacterium]
MKDPYEVLNVPKNASNAEIKKQYRRLAKQYHPDLHPDDENAKEKFSEISNAYEILSNDEKRAKYDRYGSAAFENGSSSGQGFGFEDIFSGFDDIFDIFGTGRRQQSSYDRRNAPRKGEDIQQVIKLSFRESAFGVSKEIQIRRKEKCKTCDGSGVEPGSEKVVCDKCHGTGRITQTSNTPFGSFSQTTTCDKCHGTGEIIKEKCHTCHGTGFVMKSKTVNVDIPSGVENNSVIKMSGLGNAGVNGGENGDVYLIIQVEEHEIFKRNGLDINYELPLTFVTATLGGKIKVPVLNGTKDFDIPEGTQTGTTFKIKNEGIKSSRTGEVGDIYFTVKLITPTKLNKEQKEALKKFATLSGNEVSDKKSGFFDKLKDLFE